MKKIPFILAVLVMLAGLLGTAPFKQGAASADYMPANPDKILQLLIKQGKISSSTPKDQQEAAVTAYLQLKSKGGSEDKPNPVMKKQLDINGSALDQTKSASIRGKKLGNTTSVPSASVDFMPVKDTGKLLLILVQFSDTPYTWTTDAGTSRTEAGPLHNNIPVPDNSFDLYVPDFSTQHYEDMLFKPGGWTFPANSPRYAGETRGSMYDYFVEQSYGQYAIQGKAYGWYTVNKPEAYYGDDDPAGDNDNLGPGDTSTLIADAVSVINASASPINWSEYDTNADCVIDHPLFIHAGIDQSGGGGAQGDDAIWAHSWQVNQLVATTAGCAEGLFIRNYTIMPEDGGVGVFAHEFGHDLGLPDEYDTAYSGRGASTAYWSLMSSGSWIGKPAQTQPSDISIWGRTMLGWMNNNISVVPFSALGKTPIPLTLNQAERWAGPNTNNNIAVILPPKPFMVNTPHSGSYEWWGGKANELDTTLRRPVNLTGKSSASLSFWTWYSIEENWDFGFVQVSTDGGTTWTSLPIDGTVDTIVPGGYPTIKPNMPGFTGDSGGWLYKTADLSAYAGQNILLQFRYMTDWGTTNPGFYIDDITFTADGSTVFSDGVETLDTTWSVNSNQSSTKWTRNNGIYTIPHYYMMEWRNLNAMTTSYQGKTLVNFDNGLTNAYQFDAYGSTGNPNEPWYYSYNPGLLVWYYDTAYDWADNWTGYHPGHGFLLVVDSHSQAMMRPPILNTKLGYGVLPWFTNVQAYDSPFGLDKTIAAKLGYWGVTRFYASQSGVPNFDDGKSYYDKNAPVASVIVPNYGVLFRVLGQATDGSAAVVSVGLK